MRLLHPFLSLLLLPALALGLSIQLPLPRTLHSANVNMLVTWTDVDANLTTLSILLAQGEALSVVATLGENMDASQKSANVKIPSTTVSGSDYYVVLQGNNNIQASKGPFTVIFGAESSAAGPSSATPSSMAPSSVMPSASSMPASSSSVTSPSSSSSSSSTKNTHPTDNDSSDNSSSSNGKPDSDHGLTSGQVAGIVVGIIGALAVAGVAVVFAGIARRKKEQKHTQLHSDNAKYYDDANYVIDHQQQHSRFGPPPSMPMRPIVTDKPHMHEHTY